MVEGNIDLEKYRFFKSLSEDQKVETEGELSVMEEMRDYLKTQLKSNSLDSLKDGEAVENKIKQLVDEQILWVKNRFGFDVSKRAVGPTAVGIHDRDSFLNKLRVHGQSSDIFKGFHVGPVRSIELLKQDRVESVFHSASHELIHTIGDMVIKVDDNDQEIIQQSTGYNSKNGSFTMLNEMVVEMLNIEFLDDLRTGGKADYLSGTDIGYGTVLLMFEAFFKKVADLAKMNLSELMNDLYTGYLTGDFSKLRIIDATLGKGTLKKIVDLKYEDFRSKEKTIALFKDLGVDLPINKMQSYNKSEEIEMLDGIKIKKTN
ncbi:MAG: hypothetical protein ACD_72C00507G0003 [uncultured bacterium]|nr:MAG: hypothetical protein ACD_72C00507G0003 [uncultured bacterium]